MATPVPKPLSRTQKRYSHKKEISNKTPRPVSLIGGGQGGVLGPSASAGGLWA